MSRHSTGPWRWERGATTEGADPAIEDVGFDLVDANGDDVLPTNIHDELTPSDADACLIAAAPEMLELLRSFDADALGRLGRMSHLASRVRALLARIDGSPDP